MSADPLHCGVCTEWYNETLRAPLVLRCGHTFCRSCVSQWLKCPYLCAGSNVASVTECPCNFALKDLVSAFPPPVSVSPSTICAQECDKEAIEFCCTCNALLCFLHSRTHHERNHLTLTLSSITTIKCTQHDGEFVRFFCASCEAKCCLLCLSDHRAQDHHDVLTTTQLNEHLSQQATEHAHRLDEALRHIKRNSPTSSRLFKHST